MSLNKVVSRHAGSTAIRCGVSPRRSALRTCTSRQKAQPLICDPDVDQLHQHRIQAGALPGLADDELLAPEPLWLFYGALFISRGLGLAYAPSAGRWPTGAARRPGHEPSEE